MRKIGDLSDRGIEGDDAPERDNGRVLYFHGTAVKELPTIVVSVVADVQDSRVIEYDRAQ